MQILNNGILAFLLTVQKGISTIITNPNFSYGITIIVFTIIIRIILLPLNIKQSRSQVKLQEIQPEVKKLQEKYKNDPQKSQQEMMNLYKEKGINPMSGCLPMLIQLPILWALFYAFKSLPTKHPEAAQVSFLWVHHLFGSDQYFILPILAGITTYLSSSMITPQGDSAQAKQTSTMNIFMAIFMVFMSWKFTAALVLYWVTNNLIQMGQTKILKMADQKKTA